MKLFNKVSVGLELDNNEVRAVEIMSGSPRAKLVNWGRIPIPEGIIKDGTIINSGRVSEVLKELWAVSGIKSKNVILGVMNQDVIVRFAPFPKVEDEKLKGLIQFQSQEYLPMPINTLILDYIVLDEFKKNDATMVEVLLVAAKKTMIEGFVKTCEKAQLKLQDIDVSTLSLIRLLSEQDSNTSVAFADFYSEMAGILLLKNGVPRLSRIIPVSFKNKNDQKCLPERLSIAGTKEPAPYDEDDVRKWSESLAEEINSSIDFYQSQKGASIVEKVYVCGNGIGFKGLLGNMCEKFDIPFKLISTSNKLNIKLKNDISSDGFSESDFAVCISLALRGLEEK